MTINVHQKGDLVRISGTFRDLAGAAIDPGTVALKVAKPSGATTYTFALGTVIKDSVGNYHVDVSITEAGQWSYRWESTGAGQAAEQGQFTVEPSGFA
jgi:uncharacterized protein YfaS (alpha-2-macroglobulin family)